jgi:tetratricopeptide (TPR) repeat protein
MRRLPGLLLLAFVCAALSFAAEAALHYWHEKITEFRLYPHRDRADRLLAKGDWQGAVAELDRALAIAPDNDAAIVLLRLLYEHQAYPALFRRSTAYGAGTPFHGPASYYRGLAAVETGLTGVAALALKDALASGTLDAESTRRAENLLAETMPQDHSVSVIIIAGPVPPPFTPPPKPTPPSEPAVVKASVIPPQPISPTIGPMDVAFASLKNGDLEAALRQFDRAETGDNGGIALLYRGVVLRRLHRDEEARGAFAAAVETSSLPPSDRAYAYGELGRIALASGSFGEAAADFAKAVPSGASWAELGYALLSAGEKREARSALEKAVAAAPSPALLADVAYLEKSLGAPDAAVRSFRRAIDSLPQDAPERLRLKEEVAWLERRFSLSLYSIYRPDAADPRHLAPFERSLGQSQGGLDARFIPKGLGRAADRFIAIEPRVFWSYRGHSLAIDPHSWQGEIGLSTKPLAEHDLQFSAGRLVPLGSEARSDWIVSVGYAWSHGLAPDFSPGTEHHFAARLFIDAAVIDPAHADFLADGTLTAGPLWQLGPRVLLWPHLLLSGTADDDRYGRVTLLEGGPGITMRLRLGERPYSVSRADVELTLQYRLHMAGDSKGGSGPVLALGTVF